MPELKGTLVGFCNALLDITANVEDAILTKYDLQANNAILAESKHLPLYDELVKEYTVLYTAGGSAQNTLRAAQWHLPKDSTVYVSCIGKDKFGETLRKVATEEGLRVEYLEDETASTGTCACLITGSGHCRSLVANLGAANNYRLSHLKDNEHMQKVLKEANFFYISGYFITVSLETIMYVLEHAHQNGKIVCLNLSAPFICQFFVEQLLQILPYVDYLFGNESECTALAKSLSLPENYSIDEMATHLAGMKKCTNALPNRHVIITQGSSPTIVAVANQPIQYYPVENIATEEIIDTNGAGDAFAGGFLAELVQGHSMTSCIKAGHYTASVIIRRSGITFPIRPEGLSFSNETTTCCNHAHL